MNIKTRQAGAVMIIDLKGKFVIGSDLLEFRKVIDAAIADNQVNLLLNLKDLRTIDSSGLGEITRSYTSTKRAGGVIKMVNLSSKVQDLLMITKLITIFETFDDEGAALKSF